MKKVSSCFRRKTVVRLASITPQPATRQQDSCWSEKAEDGDTVQVSPAWTSRSSAALTVFELVQRESLPCFDASKTLKTILLDANQVRRFNEVKDRGKYIIAPMLQLGNLLMLLTTVAPQHIGAVMAVVAPILQFPGVVVIAASVRVEMLRLLFGTYDFWFFTISNIAFGICFAILLRDVRITTVVVGCVIVQISIGADALVGDRRQLFLSSVINCSTHFAMFLAVVLRLVDKTAGDEATSLTYSSTNSGFSVREMLMNAQTNMIVLFARLVYRNWVAMREQGGVTGHRKSLPSIIPCRRRCVSYYCNVGLRQKSSDSSTNVTVLARLDTVTNALTPTWRPRSRAGSALSLRSIDSSRGSIVSTVPLGILPQRHDSVQPREAVRSRPGINPSPNQRHTSIPLQFVPIDKDFPAYRTLLPGFGRFLSKLLAPSAPLWRRRLLLGLLYTLGLTGMLNLSLSALVCWLTQNPDLDTWFTGARHIQTAGVTASAAFCSVFFFSYQRGLLLRLYSSFDFLFLSTKTTIASLALSFFFDKDRRVFWVWGAWIWTQWAITLDALPPTAMRLLAFRRSALMLPVLFGMLVAIVILALELFVWNRWQVPDRNFIDHEILGHKVQVRTLSLFVARLWTIFLWDCRLIWKVLSAAARRRQRRQLRDNTQDDDEDDEGERFLLTGRVEFYYEWARQRRTRRTKAKARWRKGIRALRTSQTVWPRRQSSSLDDGDQGDSRSLS